MADLESRVGNLEHRVGSVESITVTLQKDVAEIKQTLGTFATKSDIAMLAAKIDSSVNGLLRDALASMPIKQAMIWTCVSGVAAIVGVAVAILSAAH